MIKTKLFSCVLLGALALSHASFADDQTCRMPDGFIDSGVGGTSIRSNDKGIGGTGAVVNSDTKGLGGTGISAQADTKGLGGTGVFKPVYVEGPIYAFGSLCVNGLRISYSGATIIRDGGQSGNSDDFRIGQVVRVMADQVPGQSSLQARAVDVIYALEGPVDLIADDGKFIRVLGVMVKVPEGYDVSGLHVGDAVRVSGMPEAKGIDASLIGARPEGLPDQVSGKMRLAGHGQAFVGDTPIELEGVKTEPVDGANVSVRGHWSDNVLHAQEIGSPSVKAARGALVSVQGYVEIPQDKKNTKYIAAYPVTAGAKYKFSNGELLIVHGDMGARGVIRCEGVHELADDDDEPKK